MRWLILVSFSFLLIQFTSCENDFKIPATNRTKRQLASLKGMLKQFSYGIRREAHNIGTIIDQHIGPPVRYAANRITEDVAPSIMEMGNDAAVAAIQTVQHGAEVFNSQIFPAIEDKFVEIGNAAVPQINSGIDALEAGFHASVNMLRKSTAKGIDKISYKVLGEQRHNRVKNIANNLSGGLNNGINSIASAISTLGNSDTYVDYDNDVKNSNYYDQYYDYIERSPSGSVMRNAAYSISKHILGENLTQAVAPLANSISDAVEQTFPVVEVDNGKLVINLPGSKRDRADKVRACTTPYGGPGLCRDLSDCSDLVHDLSNLRKSICFKSFFVPGVCCPGNLNEGPNSIDEGFEHNKPLIIPSVGSSQPSLNSEVEQQFQQDFQTQKPVPYNRFDCGVPKVPTFRVVGGDEAKRGQWPWMAAVFLHGPRKTEFWCGASLISRRHVLTAAHCTKDPRGKTFDPQQFTVTVGDHNVFSHSDDHMTKAKSMRVAEIRPYPEFQAHGFYNDVAILKLENPIQLTEYILPVCLPSLELARQNLDYLVAQTPTVIGYGSTRYGGKESRMLRQAKLPVWKNSDCDDAYFQPITDTFLCAGFAGGGVDACQGDSGGPLQLYLDGSWVQIGIVSFGNRCAEPGYPGVYTRITHFLHWILTNMT